MGIPSSQSKIPRPMYAFSDANFRGSENISKKRAEDQKVPGRVLAVIPKQSSDIGLAASSAFLAPKVETSSASLSDGFSCVQTGPGATALTLMRFAARARVNGMVAALGHRVVDQALAAVDARDRACGDEPGSICSTAAWAI